MIDFHCSLPPRLHSNDTAATVATVVVIALVILVLFQPNRHRFGWSSRPSIVRILVVASLIVSLISLVATKRFPRCGGSHHDSASTATSSRTKTPIPIPLKDVDTSRLPPRADLGEFASSSKRSGRRGAYRSNPHAAARNQPKPSGPKADRVKEWGQGLPPPPSGAGRWQQVLRPPEDPTTRHTGAPASSTTTAPVVVARREGEPEQLAAPSTSASVVMVQLDESKLSAAGDRPHQQGGEPTPPPSEGGSWQAVQQGMECSLTGSREAPPSSTMSAPVVVEPEEGMQVLGGWDDELASLVASSGGGNFYMRPADVEGAPNMASSMVEVGGGDSTTLTMTIGDQKVTFSPKNYIGLTVGGGQHQYIFDPNGKGTSQFQFVFHETFAKGKEADFGDWVALIREVNAICDSQNGIVWGMENGKGVGSYQVSTFPSKAVVHVGPKTELAAGQYYVDRSNPSQIITVARISVFKDGKEEEMIVTLTNCEEDTAQMKPLILKGLAETFNPKGALHIAYINRIEGN